MTGSADIAPQDQGREAVLVVDLGTTTTSAILLAPDGKRRLLRHLDSGGDTRPWMPSAVFLDGDRFLVGWPAYERRTSDPACYRAEFKPDIGSSVPIPFGGPSFQVGKLVTAVLTRLREAAAESGPPPDRLLVTVPAASTPERQETMIAAGREAGFKDVELLAEPLAAAHAPVTGALWRPGQVVLVYDFGGGTFDTALVRVGTHEHELLGQDGLATGHGGRDVDAALYQDLQPAAEEWLLADPDRRSAQRGRLDRMTGDAAMTLKHRLGTAERACADITLDITPQWADRKRLGEITGPLLADTVECCRVLLDRHAVDELAGILLVGGSTRLPGVRVCLKDAFGLDPCTVEDPVLAVTRGAARWARGIPAHSTTGMVPSPSGIPLRWPIPCEEAVLERWLVAPNDHYSTGSPVARVRLDNGSLHDLRAPFAGRVVQLHAAAGDRVFGGDWLVTVSGTSEPGGEARFNVVPWATSPGRTEGNGRHHPERHQPA